MNILLLEVYELQIKAACHLVAGFQSASFPFDHLLERIQYQSIFIFNLNSILNEYI